MAFNIAVFGMKPRAQINVGTRSDLSIAVTTSTPFNWAGSPPANAGGFVNCGFACLVMVMDLAKP